MKVATLGLPPADSNFVPKKIEPAAQATQDKPMLFAELLMIADDEPRSAALNMAMDEALFSRADRPTLRAYRWANSAISFGYFGCYEEVRHQFPDRELVRRWTGGGVVDHANDFTYSLILPGPPTLSSREIYCEVHLAIAKAWGEDATVAEADVAPVSSACFENPVIGDVLAGGRKVAGAALRRARRGLLLQGSVTPRKGGLLERLVGNLSPDVAVAEIPAEVAVLAENLSAERYSTKQWLKRR